LRHYSTEAILELFAQHEIPVGRVNSRDAVLTDPQITASGTLERFSHPRAGDMIHPRSPARFSKTEVGSQRPSPDLGEHTADVLMELGYSIETLQDWAREGIIG
jgi:crotonobetainyl-CoA:carnitine CoA-transferase CaiB-like acyl-CoA transferase